MAAPVAIADMAAANRQAGYATYYAAAMAILFVFLAAQFGVVSIHAERRARTLARMLAAPLHWWSIVAGKLMVSMVLALVSLGVIIVGTGSPARGHLGRSGRHRRARPGGGHGRHRHLAA